MFLLCLLIAAFVLIYVAIIAYSYGELIEMRRHNKYADRMRAEYDEEYSRLTAEANAAFTSWYVAGVAEARRRSHEVLTAMLAEYGDEQDEDEDEDENEQDENEDA